MQSFSLSSSILWARAEPTLRFSFPEADRFVLKGKNHSFSVASFRKGLSYCSQARVAFSSTDPEHFYRTIDDWKRFPCIAVVPYCHQNAQVSSEPFLILVWDREEQISVSGEKQNPKINLHFDLEERRESFLHKVSCVKQEMKQGDYYLLNLCERVSLKGDGLSAEQFVKCWSQKPSRFGFYANLPQFQCAMFSPELFIYRNREKIFTQPMKGTTLIGSHLESAKEKLWKSEKEICEQTLVIDLLRNDFNSFCEPGSVGLENPCELIGAGNLLQMQSTVSGILKNKKNSSILKSLTPAGSMTGAPKSSVCNAIKKYEKSARGYYSGFTVFMQSTQEWEGCINIRGYFGNQQQLYAGVGAGITVLSEPVAEWEEVKTKLKSFSEFS